MPATRSFVAAILIASASPASGARADQAEPDWRTEWSVEEGFALEVDSAGYDFPTGIALIPNPGDDPADPRYFVTELEGAIKVVTNDRSVHLFATTPLDIPRPTKLPDQEGEVGQVSICLAPERGFVFVTFAYRDAEGVLRNGMARYDATPSTFALEPHARLDILEPFASDRSTVAHQIGGCAVDGDHVYVGVGDGQATELARSLTSSLGKILRMTLDGRPDPTNPFFEDDGEDRPEDFVWAYGLRNPFGLTVAEGRLFVTDNGPAVDRLVEIERGGDYRWSGSDWSVSMRADMSFAPSIGPVQLDFAAGTEDRPQDPAQSFLIASAGPPAAVGPGTAGEKSVLAVPFDLEAGEVAEVPKILVSYRGDRHQSVVGVAAGQDGVYFVPLFPGADGETRVLRTFFDPARPHPHLVGHESGAELIQHYGCLGCHTIGKHGVALGPPLNRDGLVRRVDARLDKFRANGRDVPREVEAILELGSEAGVRAWVAHHISQPGFDTGSSSMPDVGVELSEAEMIADYLIPKQDIQERVTDMIGPIGLRKLGAAIAVSFALGLALGGSGWALVAVQRKRRRAAGRAAP